MVGRESTGATDATERRVKDMANETGLVQSVDRAVTVLEILGRDGTVGVSELARRMDIHKSTVSRLLATLERRGIVEQQADGVQYSLGVGLVRLARSVTEDLDVVALARPVAEDLSRASGETVNLSLLEGGEVVNVDEVNLSDSVLSVTWLGRHTSLHNTANGKIFLAHLDEAEVGRILAGDLEATTEHTVTDPGELRRQMAEIRRSGHAWQYEELEPGLSAVAAPVRDSGGAVLATISVAGPTFRMSQERIPELTRLTVEAAESISRKLGRTEPRAG